MGGRRARLPASGCTASALPDACRPCSRRRTGAVWVHGRELDDTLCRGKNKARELLNTTAAIWSTHTLSTGTLTPAFAIVGRHTLQLGARVLPTHALRPETTQPAGLSRTVCRRRPSTTSAGLGRKFLSRLECGAPSRGIDTTLSKDKPHRQLMGSTAKRRGRAGAVAGWWGATGESHVADRHLGWDRAWCHPTASCRSLSTLSSRAGRQSREPRRWLCGRRQK